MKEAAGDIHISDEQRSRVYHAVEFMQEHIDQSITGDDLATAAGFSRYHFHRIFTTVMGETPMQALNRLRLEYAANLMIKNPEMKLTSIAMMCGFSSSAVFSRSFKTQYGLRPIEYRRNNPFLDVQSTLPASMDRITVQDMPAFHVAALRSRNGYTLPSICETWEKIRLWAQANNLFDPSMRFLGISLDDPTITEAFRCRYYAALETPPAVKLKSPYTHMEIPEGKYIFFECRLHPEQIQPTYQWIFQHGLPDAQYRYAGGLVYENYLTAPGTSNSNDLDLEIAIPVKK